MNILKALSGKRVLVTGHTGFKGGWLSRMLQHLGAEVAGLSLLPPTTPSLFDDAKISEGIHSVIADIRDVQRLGATVKDVSPEVVFHLAAQPLVRAAYREPVETFSTNVLGTVHVLEALRSCESVRAIVVATTDKVYHNEEWAWGYREIDRLGGDEPYSASKAAAEVAVAAYRRSYFSSRATPCGVATVRAGNVIGGGDWAEDRIVPDIVRGAVSNSPIEIRSPSATRPWQHVADPLLGYLRLAALILQSPGEYAEGWNFGPLFGAQTVWALAEKVSSRLGVRLVDASANHDGPKETRTLVLDSSKAMHRLGWRPQFDFEQAAELTATWYAEWLRDRASARAMLDRQILLALEQSG